MIYSYKLSNPHMLRTNEVVAERSAPVSSAMASRNLLYLWIQRTPVVCHVICSTCLLRPIACYDIIFYGCYGRMIFGPILFFDIHHIQFPHTTQ